MTGFMVPGSPYVTFDFTDSTPILTSGQGAITSFTGTSVTSGGSTGDFQIFRSGDRHR